MTCLAIGHDFRNAFNLTFQCSGTSPSHSMPDGFMGASGFRPLGDGVGDDGLALFFQQLHQPPLLCHQRINLRGFAVEEGGDLGLLGERWNGNWNRDDARWR